MLSRGHTTIQRQEGEGETEAVRIPSIQRTTRPVLSGFCSACRNWTVQLVKVGNLDVCSGCEDTVGERLNKRA